MINIMDLLFLFLVKEIVTTFFMNYSGDVS